MNLTEDYIQKLVKAFDYEKALTEIISVYHEPLYWLIRKLVISHEDTNDVLQNTYLRIYKGLSNFRFQSTIKTWCYRIAYNESMRHLEQMKKGELLFKNGELPDYLIQLCADPFFDDQQADFQFQRLLVMLTEEQRVIFSMRYYDELKFTEIANITGRNINSIKTIYYSSKKLLIDQLKESL